MAHSGFKFEKNPKISAELLKLHSGGAGSKALLLAVRNGTPKLPKLQPGGTGSRSTEPGVIDPLQPQSGHSETSGGSISLPSSAISTDEESLPSSSAKEVPNVLVDYRSTDYRGFVFVGTFRFCLRHSAGFITPH